MRIKTKNRDHGLRTFGELSPGTVFRFCNGYISNSDNRFFMALAVVGGPNCVELNSGALSKENPTTKIEVVRGVFVEDYNENESHSS